MFALKLSMYTLLLLPPTSMLVSESMSQHKIVSVSVERAPAASATQREMSFPTVHRIGSLCISASHPCAQARNRWKLIYWRFGTFVCYCCFCFVFGSDIYYQMLTNVLCVFFHVTPSLILSCCIQTADLVQFCGFSPQIPPRMCAISALSFFHTGCLHFGLIPRGLCVCIRSGRTFPSLLSFASFLLGFSYRATHVTIVCRPRVCRLVTSRHNHRYSPVCQS